MLNWPRPEPLVGLGNDGKLKPPPKEGMEKDGMLNWGTGEALLKLARAAMYAAEYFISTVEWNDCGSNESRCSAQVASKRT
jgi:hypothetical protein